MSDRKELESLRLSVARIAQVLGIEDEVLLTDPMLSAHTKERGWNDLAGQCVEKASEVVRDLKIFRKTFAVHVSRLSTPGLTQPPEDAKRLDEGTTHRG
jgi:hypothetical protein